MRLFNETVAQQHKIGVAFVHKILKKNKWHLYELHLIQELSEDDFDKYVQFCNLINEMMIKEMINDNPLFLDNIVFSDELTFELTGNVNRYNCR